MCDAFEVQMFEINSNNVIEITLVTNSPEDTDISNINQQVIAVTLV